MVSSVNNQTGYERNFSLGKTVTSAATGAALFKISNDAILRKNASQTLQALRGAGADEFIKANNLSGAAVKASVKNAQKVLKTTDYLNKFKETVKVPNKETVTKVVDTVKNTAKNTNVNSIKTAATNFAGKITKTAKSLKGETLKETVAKVMKASKTVKGRQATTLALGAICGLLLFGTSKIEKKQNA